MTMDDPADPGLAAALWRLALLAATMAFVVMGSGTAVRAGPAEDGPPCGSGLS